MRPDLVQHVGELVREQGPEHIVIEASGVSEPGNIVRTLGYPELADTVFVSAVVTVVDAEQFPQLRGTARYLANEQLAAADIVVVNKSELVAAAALEQVVAHCRLPGNFVQACSFARIPATLLFFERDMGRRASARAGQQSASALFESRTWQPGSAVDLAALREVIRNLPPVVFRSKGFVTCSETGQSWLVQKVGTRTTFQPVAEPREDGLVLIAERGAVDWREALGTLHGITPPQGGRRTRRDAGAPVRTSGA